MTLAELMRAGGAPMIGISVVGALAYGLLVDRALRLTGPAARRGDAALARRCLATLPLARACIAAAPLLGLLGTVTGLVTSFEAMVGGGRAEALAGGIGQALWTTAYGLMVAAPALVFAGLVERRAHTVAQRAIEDHT